MINRHCEDLHCCGLGEMINPDRASDVSSDLRTFGWDGLVDKGDGFWQLWISSSAGH